MLFVQNFKIMLSSSGTLAANANMQYLSILLCGEVLFQFDNLFAQVVIMTIAHLNRVILNLCTYFPPVNLLSKQKRMMRRGMRKKHELKVKRYTDFITDINEYLADFPGTKIVENIGETKLNKILLKRMPNGRSKNAHEHVFDF